MEERLKKIMAGVFNIDINEINKDISIHNVEAWDSLAQMKLVFAIEEEFGVVFDEDEIQEMVSFNAIIGMLEK